MKRAVVLGLLVSMGCIPGIEIELENQSDREIGVSRVVEGLEVHREVLAPHASLTLGPAHIWYVHIGSERFELLHPGREFAGRTWTSSEIYRFRISAEGCVYAVSPDSIDASGALLEQPPGYPLGAAGACRGVP